MNRIVLSTFFVLITFLVHAQGIDNSLYTFDFLQNDSIPVEQRVEEWSKIGYKGVTFGIGNKNQIEKLKQYLATKEVKAGEFSVPVVYFPIEIGSDGSWNQFWKQSLQLSPNTSLWVIITNRQKHATEEKVVSMLQEMCTEAQKVGADVVIYPHDNTFIESVEDAIPYIEKVAMPNLYLTMHLCHELRAGNRERLLDVAIKAAPHLKYASLSGADYTMRHNTNADWTDAIKPLDEGDYPVEEFVMVIQKIRFNSLMFLHTFGIKQPVTDHLTRSFAKWNKMLEQTSTQLNTQLDLILDNPENAYWDKNSQTWFISNLGGEKVTIEKDGYGWITRLDKNRKIIATRWVEGLDAPTGMAAFENRLYVGDRGVLVEIDIEQAKIIRKIPLPDAEFVNDVSASFTGDIFVSDTFTDRIYRLDANGKLEVFIKSSKLEYPNGLWVDGDKLIVATWGPMTNRATFETSRKGTLLKVDLKTKEIIPVGLGKPIANFDGVVKYGDYYYGTDWTGGRLLQISEEGDVKELLSGFSQFADLGIDPEKGMLMIPEMSKNRFITLNLNGKK